MKKCKCLKKRKHLPYGTKALTSYCIICDRGPHLDVSKNGERDKAKRAIKKDLDEREDER